MEERNAESPTDVELMEAVVRRDSDAMATIYQRYESTLRAVILKSGRRATPRDLQLRPIYHQVEHRVEAHIFVAFLAYCLHVTLRARLKPLAPGLTSRAVLDKMAAVQMLDVHFPTTDGRMLILSRYTELNADQKLLLKQLKLDLPPQPPPRITSSQRFARPQVPVL